MKPLNSLPFTRPSFCWLPLFHSTAMAKNVVDLYQSDFADGTYQITEPGVYRLAEDISFKPNPVERLPSQVSRRWTPIQRVVHCLQFGTYDPAAFGITFAAITVAAKNVVIDLNGHTMSRAKSTRSFNASSQ